MMPAFHFATKEVVDVDGGFEGARSTGRQSAGWADMITDA
jgi:hypothetical protein